MGLVLAPPGSFSQDLAGRSLFLLQPLFSCLSLTEAPLTVLRMASVTQCPTQWVTHGSPEHHQSLLAELRGLQRQPGHSRTRTPSHGDATQDGHPRSDPSSAAHVVAPPQMTARAATEGCPGHPQGGANPCRDRGPPPEPGPPPPPRRDRDPCWDRDPLPEPGPPLVRRGPAAGTGTPPHARAAPPRAGTGTLPCRDQAPLRDRGPAAGTGPPTRAGTPSRGNWAPSPDRDSHQAKRRKPGAEQRGPDQPPETGTAGPGVPTLEAWPPRGRPGTPPAPGSGPPQRRKTHGEKKGPPFPVFPQKPQTGLSQAQLRSSVHVCPVPEVPDTKHSDWPAQVTCLWPVPETPGTEYSDWQAPVTCLWPVPEVPGMEFWDWPAWSRVPVCPVTEV